MENYFAKNDHAELGQLIVRVGAFVRHQNVTAPVGVGRKSEKKSPKKKKK